MSPYLPVESLDHVADLLHDTECSLRNCCLISKSWVPCTRKHLFADIKIRSEDHLRPWNETFPDPSTSPAHYTKTLYVGCPHVITATDTELDGWITGFSSVVHLGVADRESSIAELTVSLVPFHGFSPVIKSLRVAFFIIPSSRVFNLIISFPLEDLTVVAYRE